MFQKGIERCNNCPWGFKIEAGDLQWCPRQPRESQERSKERQDGLQELQDVLQERPRWPKRAQDAPKKCLRGARWLPRWAKIAQGGAQDDKKANKKTSRAQDEKC